MKKKLTKFIYIFSFLSLLPAVVSAQTTFTAVTTVACSGTGIGKIICQAQQILNSIVPVLVGLGVVFFVWGVVMYVIADEEEAKKKGRDRMIYGIIGLAVIVGLWGLVNIVVSTFGIGGVQAPSLTTLTPSQVTTNSGSCPTLGSSSKFQDYLNYFTTCIINNSVIPLLFAVAVIMFIWGVFQFFILNAEDEKKRTEGKQFMIWGIVALAVMLSVWGLVGILGNTFGLGDSIKVLPQVHPPTSS